MGTESIHLQLIACLLLMLAHSAVAYDFLIVNNATNGAFFQEIKDEFTSEVIGEMYTDVVYNEGGRKVGLHPGYSFNFDNGNETSYTSNGVWDLEDGQLQVYDDSYIVAASGAYQKYEGGIVSYNILQFDPEFRAEITLTLPDEEETTPIATDGEDQTLTFTLVSEGGYYSPIKNSTGDQIGERFQNLIYDEFETLVGINEGFGFNYPNNTYIIDSLGFDPFEFNNGNRKFLMEDGETLILFNKLVVDATGPYKKYKGSLVEEKVLSTDPDWVSTVTLSLPIAEGEDDSVEAAPAFFTITSEGNWEEGIIDPDTNQWIGERFQNAVITPDGTRIGTNQGYGFNFESRTLANRILYLKDGIINVLNEEILHGSGAYAKYTGGTIDQNVLQYRPFFQAEIRLKTAEESTADPSGPAPSPTADTDGSSGSSVFHRGCFLSGLGLLSMAIFY